MLDRLVQGGINGAMTDPQTQSALGLGALNAGNHALAIEHFVAAAEGDASAPPLWMNLAKAHRVAGDDKAEREALEQVLAIDQMHLMALIRLAELHERRGEMGSATDRWSMVLGIGSRMTGRPPEFEATLRYAQDFVGRRRQALSEAVDQGLAEALAAANERDHRRASAAADLMLGGRRIFSDQRHGFFYPFLPADEFFDRGHFPWLGQLEAGTAAIREELEAILASADPGLAPYIDMPPGTPPNLWSELDKSPNWSALHLWRDGERIAEV